MWRSYKPTYRLRAAQVGALGSGQGCAIEIVIEKLVCDLATSHLALPSILRGNDARVVAGHGVTEETA